MVEKATKEIIETVIVILVVFILGIFIPAAALFIGKGAEATELLEKTTWYYGVLGASLFALAALNIAKYLVLTKKISFNSWGWANGIVYDPELSPLSDTFLGKYIKRPGFMLKWGIVIFSIMGVFAAATNTFFAGVPNTEFQVTKTAELILAVEPAVSSETLLFGVVISLLVGLAYWWTKKNNYGNGILIFFYFIISGLIGLLWMGYHTFRYGGDEFSLVATFVFGAGGTLLTIFTGSLLWWYIWHFFNNLYFRANSLFSDEMILVVSISTILIYIIVLFILHLRRNKKAEVVVNG